MRLRRTLLPYLLAGLAACGTSASQSTVTTAGSARRQADLITAEELTSADSPNLHLAIQRLRPNWLRSRGQVSIQTPDAGMPVVYFEETRLGGLQTLEQIVPGEVREVQRLSAAEATNRFGTGHAGGAIVVRRRTGR